MKYEKRLFASRAKSLFLLKKRGGEFSDELSTV